MISSSNTTTTISRASWSPLPEIAEPARLAARGSQVSPKRFDVLRMKGFVGRGRQADAAPGAGGRARA